MTTQTQSPTSTLNNSFDHPIIKVESTGVGDNEPGESSSIASSPQGQGAHAQAVILNENESGGGAAAEKSEEVLESLEKMEDETPAYLGILFLATAGQNGENLGSDEAEVVLLVLSIIHHSKVDGSVQVLGTNSFVVQPSRPDENENFLSDECKTQFNLSEEEVKSGARLEEVIQKIREMKESLVPESEGFQFVTDGQLPLRQSLHPLACSKGIQLPSIFNSFFDLKKEFQRTIDSSQQIPQNIQTLILSRNGNGEDHQPEGVIMDQLGVEDMLASLNLEVNEDLERILGTNPYNQLDNDLEKERESSKKEPLGKIPHMVAIVTKLLAMGHVFQNPEKIRIKLEPGLCSKTEQIIGDCVVRARGLPWQSSDQDIANFFRGLNVGKGGVALCISPQGRRNGEALIRLDCPEHRRLAVRRHKHHIGSRYIEVYKATNEDFLNVAGGCNNEAAVFLTRGGQVIIRMRGLPYDCTAKQVVEFFESESNSDKPSCSVLDGEDGVLFVKRLDGRATGDAFVLFPYEEDAPKALSKHREIIGTRYIELFRSTPAEVQQVLNRCIEQQPNPQSNSSSSPQGGPGQKDTRNELILPSGSQMSPILPPLVSPVSMGHLGFGTGGALGLMSPGPPMSQHPSMMTSPGSKRDCIRLRGLPFEAKVEDILEFLGEFSKHIALQGVHMVYNPQGQPSGEAFIQMDSEPSAYLTAQAKHNRYMTILKKQRYVEVFQCSCDDMNIVLNGGSLSPGSGGGGEPSSPGSKQMMIQPPVSSPVSPSSGMFHHQPSIQAGVQGFIGGLSPGGPIRGGGNNSAAGFLGHPQGGLGFFRPNLLFPLGGMGLGHPGLGQPPPYNFMNGLGVGLGGTGGPGILGSGPHLLSSPAGLMSPYPPGQLHLHQRNYGMAVGDELAAAAMIHRLNANSQLLGLHGLGGGAGGVPGGGLIFNLTHQALLAQQNILNGGSSPGGPPTGTLQLGSKRAWDSAFPGGLDSYMTHGGKRFHNN